MNFHGHGAVGDTQVYSKSTLDSDQLPKLVGSDKLRQDEMDSKHWHPLFL